MPSSTINDKLEFYCIRCGRKFPYKNRRLRNYIFCDVCFAPRNRHIWKGENKVDGNPPLLSLTPESIRLIEENDEKEKARTNGGLLCQITETAQS